MRKKYLVYALLLGLFFITSCNKGGYKRTENGAMMKFFSINKDNEKPQIGDLVAIDLVQKIDDSIVFSSNDLEEPFEFIVEEPAFKGDIMCALLSMHLNDNASLIFAVDSLFYSIGEDLPSFIKAGTLTEMNITIKEIVRKEVIEEELLKESELLKAEEKQVLSKYYSDNKYDITEDSLIIVNIDKGVGRFAKPGDIMKVYFTFQTFEGDTLLDFFAEEPYELAFGDKALGEGFYEALSLVAKGGEAEFIIPSSLAFGSEGFEGVILPYTTFKLHLKVVDIMTSDEYEAEQKAIMEKEAAINAKRIQEEPIVISNYLKNNNINVAPTSSGLYFMETKPGNGDSVKLGDVVSIHYSIYNLEDQLVESSYVYGQPLKFVYGNSQMIPGIEEAVSYMKAGGSARIIVPSALGFGEIEISDELPAYSTLVIDLELVGLNL